MSFSHQPATMIEIRKECSQWLENHPTPLYRGDDELFTLAKDGPKYLDLSKTNRLSRNTSFHYQVIFENHPQFIRQKFPKRTSCIITSTKRENVKSYGKSVVILPKNNTNLAWCGFFDMWETTVTIAGVTRTIDAWNDVLKEIPSLTESWKTWETYSNAEEFYNEAKRQGINFNKEKLDLFFKNFSKNIQAAYDPKKLKLYIGQPNTSATHLLSSGQEIWFSNGAYILSISDYEIFKGLMS